MCTVIGILIIGEYLIYFIVAMSWNVPVEKSEHDLRILFISDPQIQVSKKDELCALQTDDQIVGARVGFQLGHNWNPYHQPLSTIRCQQTFSKLHLESRSGLFTPVVDTRGGGSRLTV